VKSTNSNDIFLADGVLEILEFYPGKPSKMRVARRYAKDKTLLISKYVPLYFSFNLYYNRVKKPTANVYSDLIKSINYIGIFC